MSVKAINMESKNKKNNKDSKNSLHKPNTNILESLLSNTIPPNRFYGILVGILCAVFLSAFIYLECFLDEKNFPLYSTIFAFLGFFLYFKLPRLGAFICGGCIGILWFYWVGFSFRFYGITYLMPLVWVVFFVVYGALFYVFCFFKNPVYRLSSLVLSSFIHPFGFNWFIIESVLVKSYFFPSKFTLFLFLFGIVIFSTLLTQKLYKTSLVWLVLICFILPANSQIQQVEQPLKIKTTRTEIPQDLRWQSEQLHTIIAQNHKIILEAIQANYDVIILPETAFPLSLNLQPQLIHTLKSLSQDITIITGAIHQENNHFFNSAYVFTKGDMQIFDKHILVPFGETIPLPRFLATWINKIFFNGAEDFSIKDSTTPNFTWINGQRFQIAICYEATRDELYANSPKNLIAISNNAWFIPSIEPTLQKLLMLYFAKNHNTRIYHSSNASPNFTLP